MTENDGLDVIVAASGGGVSAPGVTERRGRPVPPDRGDLGGRHGPGLRRPVDGGVGEPDQPHRGAGRRRAPHAVRGEREPHRPGHVDGGVQLGRPGAHRSTRCRSSSTWPTPCPANPRRAGPAWVGPVPRAWTGASRSSRPRPSPSAPTCWPTWAATAATPTPATSPARPTAAPSTRRRRAWPPPTTRPAQVMVMPNGQIATTEYSASTGGYTSSANEESPFTAVPDDGDAVLRIGRLQPQPPMDGLGHLCRHRDRVAPARHLHRLRRRRLRSRPSRRRLAFGRVDTITLDGTAAPRVTVPGTEFYDDLGLNSDLFSVTSINGSTVSVMGQGWGHGIGMGQWGALGYALGQDNGEGNWTYQQIVNHFYGPAQLSNLPGGASRGRRQRRGRRVLDQRRPTGASSASATPSSTAAPGACG